jgi:hypothetical protein
MRKSNWTPSIVPKGDDQNVYLVVDDFGRNGRVYREADVETTDLETVILDLLEGQYKNPVRVVAFKRCLFRRYAKRAGSSASTLSRAMPNKHYPD